MKMTHFKFSPYPPLMDKYLLSQYPPRTFSVETAILALAKTNKYLSKLAIDFFSKVNKKVRKNLFQHEIIGGLDKTLQLQIDQPLEGTLGYVYNSKELHVSNCAGCALSYERQFERRRILMEDNFFLVEQNISELEQVAFHSNSRNFSIAEQRNPIPNESFLSVSSYQQPSFSNMNFDCICKKQKKASFGKFRSSQRRFTTLSLFLMFVLLLGSQIHLSSAIPIRWDLSPFGDCNVTCGRGIQNRSVICREMPEGLNSSHSHSHRYDRPKGNQMPDLMCPAPKPPESQVCSQVACAPKWVYGPWSKCSRTCRRGLQSRTRFCMQKLGTGKTSRVPDEYCPKAKLLRRRYCNPKRKCPAHWHISHWSTCQASCGSGVRTRVVACAITLSKFSKPIRVPDSDCPTHKKPIDEKICKNQDCDFDSHFSRNIANSQNEFIQRNTSSKVRLLVGQRAIIISGTTLIIKCIVKKFPVKNITWLYNGQIISHISQTSNGHPTKTRVGILEEGHLRILHVRKTDSGIYFCSAGDYSEQSYVTVVSSLAEVNNQTALANDDLDVQVRMHWRKQEADVRLHQQNDINLDTAVIHPDVRQLPQYTHKSSHLRRQPVTVSTLEPVPKVLHNSEISHALARPVEVRSSGVPEDSFVIDDDDSSRNIVSRLHFLESPHVISRALQLISEQRRKSSSGPLASLLNRYVETSALYGDGSISEEERDDRFAVIMSEINRRTGKNREGIAQRRNVESSPDFVNHGTITLTQEDFEVPAPAIINVQPTTSSIQHDPNVSTYVGGDLMVVNAVRVTILCEASGIPRPKITWYRNGKKLPEPEKKYSQFILPEGSLRLLYLKISDGGTYKCVASNSLGSDSRTTELKVMSRPRILSVTDTLENFQSDVIEATVGSDIRAKLGARIIIKCPVQGDPPPFVVWMKDANGLGQNTYILTDNSLVIDPATEAYQGMFGCEASSPAGSDYQASSLVLIDPPHISDDLNVLPDIDGISGLPDLLLTGERVENYSVKVNSTVMMGCPIRGFPNPEITWLFRGHRLDNPNSLVDFELMNSKRILKISKVNDLTKGIYTCFASNEGGTLTTTLHLKVIVYSYELGEMTPCSASCGGNGFQFRRLMCLRDNVTEVDEWYCTGLQKPVVTMRLCNRKDCPPKLVPGSWSQCSASCGNGTRVRSPTCVILRSSGSLQEVAAGNCNANLTEFSFETTTYCYMKRCPEWKVEPWGECSRKCVISGFGSKTRRISCVDSIGKKVRNRHCPAHAKPKRKSFCPNSRCDPVWVTSQWSACSQTCGLRGFRTRIVNCVYRGRRRQPAGNQCTDRGMPTVKRPCNRKRCYSRKRPLSNRTKISDSLCIDKFSWCERAKKVGRCRNFPLSCCRSCK